MVPDQILILVWKPVQENQYHGKHSITARINPTSPSKMDFITCKCQCKFKCCGAILSLVQFLFSFVNNRIAKFPLAKKADLVTQSFMSLHDNV